MSDSARIGTSNVAKPQAVRSRSTAMTLNLVAMIDVVFLLLMYFLLTANFMLGERVYAIEVPSTTPAGQEDPFDLPDRPLLVTVVTTGPSTTDYVIRLDLPMLEPPRDFDGLFRFLDDRQVRPEHPGGLLMPDNPIHIQPGRATRWEHAVNALNACLRARYTNVQLVEPR